MNEQPETPDPEAAFRALMDEMADCVAAAKSTQPFFVPADVERALAELATVARSLRIAALMLKKAGKAARKAGRL